MGLDDGKWTQEEDHTFEDSLAKIDDSKNCYPDQLQHGYVLPIKTAVSDRWEQIAAMLPGKSSEDVKLR